jgi:cytochrome o ubiquinol oxidase subunit 2
MPHCNANGEIMSPSHQPRFGARLRANLRSWSIPAAALALAPLLGGCDMIVMNPAGDVARQQANLIVASTILMLLIVVPVMAMIVVFAWKYRQKADAPYDPEWDHSTGLELVIWSAPLLIIIALGALTWISTHTLDPYRPIGRIAPGKPTSAAAAPLQVDVVALDWKWLFIYPEQGIATVNELVLPVDRPVSFRLTSTSVMNAFYVPAMAGMIYTMPGMQTKLHAVMNRQGVFDGFSSNYSGAGFSGMHFKTTATDQAGFDRWVAGVKGGAGALTDAQFLTLEKPSENVPVMRFASVAPNLFSRAVDMCVKPGSTCMSRVMMKDMPHNGAVMQTAPTNNTDQSNEGGQNKGALQKTPEEKGTSPHMTAPHGAGQAPGEKAPGSNANRNMTQTDLPAPRGTPAAAAAIKA